MSTTDDTIVHHDIVVDAPIQHAFTTFVERFGDWTGQPFTGGAPLQLCVCESA